MLLLPFFIALMATKVMDIIRALFRNPSRYWDLGGTLLTRTWFTTGLIFITLHTFSNLMVPIEKA
jgi:hypothetical protein